MPKMHEKLVTPDQIDELLGRRRIIDSIDSSERQRRITLKDKENEALKEENAKLKARLQELEEANALIQVREHKETCVLDLTVTLNMDIISAINSAEYHGILSLKRVEKALAQQYVDDPKTFMEALHKSAHDNPQVRLVGLREKL